MAEPSSPPLVSAPESRAEASAGSEVATSKPIVPPTHPAAYPVMGVPVSDPLWRRPALLASALAGLLVGMAAYGVRWTREQVQAYEPSVATAAAQEPDKSPLSMMVPAIEHADKADSADQRAPKEKGEPSPSRAIPSKDEARTKRSPARAPRAKAVSPARPSNPPPAAEPTEVAASPAPPPAAEPPKPHPTTIAEAIVESKSDSEPQAKTQPTSAVAAVEGYTPFDRDSARSALADVAKSASRCRSDAGPFGAARVAVTFAPSGQTTTAVVQGPPFAGTPVGSCIALAFREARVSPFSGAPVTVRTSVTIF